MKPCLKSTTKIHPSRVYKAKPTGPLIALRGSALVTQPLSGCPLKLLKCHIWKGNAEPTVTVQVKGRRRLGFAHSHRFCPHLGRFYRTNLERIVSPQVEALVRTKVLLQGGTRQTPVFLGIIKLCTRKFTVQGNRMKEKDLFENFLTYFLSFFICVSLRDAVSFFNPLRKSYKSHVSTL